MILQISCFCLIYLVKKRSYTQYCAVCFHKQWIEWLLLVNSQRSYQLFSSSQLHRVLVLLVHLSFSFWFILTAPISLVSKQSRGLFPGGNLSRTSTLRYLPAPNTRETKLESTAEVKGQWILNLHSSGGWKDLQINDCVQSVGGLPFSSDGPLFWNPNNLKNDPLDWKPSSPFLFVFFTLNILVPVVFGVRQESLFRAKLQAIQRYRHWTNNYRELSQYLQLFIATSGQTTSYWRLMYSFLIILVV